MNPEKYTEEYKILLRNAYKCIERLQRNSPEYIKLFEKFVSKTLDIKEMSMRLWNLNKLKELSEKINKMLSGMQYLKNESERYKTLADECIYDISVSNLKSELYALSVELTSEVEK